MNVCEWKNAKLVVYKALLSHPPPVIQYSFPLPPPDCVFDFCWVLPADCWNHERVQQEGPDAAEQCLCHQWPGAAGSGRRHRLLAVPGGGRHYASEPERWHQDVAALWPVESLLPEQLVLGLKGHAGRRSVSISCVAELLGFLVALLECAESKGSSCSCSCSRCNRAYILSLQ